MHILLLFDLEYSLQPGHCLPFSALRVIEITCSRDTSDTTLLKVM